MKKLAGLFLAATLTLSMTTVAFAAPSKSTTVSDGTTKEGATVSHEIKDDVKTAAGLVTDEKTGKVTLSDEQVTKVEDAIKASENAESVDVKVIDVFDVQAPADYVEGEPIDITLDFEYTEGIQVLHFQDGEWVVLPTKKGADGKVVATFTKFSPTAIATVVVNAKETKEDVTPVTPVTPSDDSTIAPSDSTTTDNTIAPADNSKTATPAATPASGTTAKADTTATKSVKGGDVNTTVYVALLAAAAGACAIVIRRKMAR